MRELNNRKGDSAGCVSREKKSVVIRPMTLYSTCWKKIAFSTWGLKSSQRDVANCCRRNPAKRFQLTKHMDKQQDLTCPTVTELEVSNAFKRRALAFDLVGACAYDVMAAYHADLLDHLHTLPPPGYSAVSVQQVLRADRAAFMFLSERMTSLKRNATNQLPLDLQLTAVLGQPNFAFHLLALSGNSPKAPAAPKSSNPKRRSRTPRNQSRAKGGPKTEQAKAVDPISQPALSTKL